MKKVALIVAVIMCLSAAGCGAKEQTAPADAATAAQTEVKESEEAPADKPETAAETGSDTLYASIQHEVDSPEWVTKLPEAQDENTKQLFVVGAMGMDLTTATVSMNQRDSSGKWKQILSSPAYVGKNGMIKDEERAEGCGRTPLGTYRFTKAFGISDDPGCALPYVKVDEDIYWSGDPREGMRYNEMVNIKDLPDLDPNECEHIIEYEYPYRYCLNIGFNEEGTPGRGSAIFLHCLGSAKPYTGGCVAVPENIMKLIMQRVDPECVVVIGLFEDMGGSF